MFFEEIKIESPLQYTHGPTYFQFFLEVPIYSIRKLGSKNHGKLAYITVYAS